MTAKEAREIRKNNPFELTDWQMNNTEALNAVDSAIEHLMRIRRTLQRDSDILKSLSHAAWNLSDNLSLA